MKIIYQMISFTMKIIWTIVHYEHNNGTLPHSLSQLASPLVLIIMWLTAQLISEGAADYEAPSNLKRWSQA